MSKHKSVRSPFIHAQVEGVYVGDSGGGINFIIGDSQMWP